MPGKSVCFTVLPRSDHAQLSSGSVCHVIRLTVSTLHGMRLCFNNLMHFKLQKVFIFYEI